MRSYPEDSYYVDYFLRFLCGSIGTLLSIFCWSIKPLDYVKLDANLVISIPDLPVRVVGDALPVLAENTAGEEQDAAGGEEGGHHQSTLTGEDGLAGVVYEVHQQGAGEEYHCVHECVQSGEPDLWIPGALELGEGEDSEGGEEEKGGLGDEDLQRVLVGEVQGGEDRQQHLGEE